FGAFAIAFATISLIVAARVPGCLWAARLLRADPALDDERARERFGWLRVHPARDRVEHLQSRPAAAPLRQTVGSGRLEAEHSLLEPAAPVHREHVAGDVGRVIGHEIRACARDLLLAAEAAERNLPQQRLAHGLVRPETLACLLRIDRPRRDRVDTDAVRSPFDGERPRQT